MKSFIRRLVPPWLRALRWRWHWLRRTDVYRAAPLTSLRRLLGWTLRGLVSDEVTFSTPDGLHFVSSPHNFTALVLYIEGRKDAEMDRFIGRHLRLGDIFVDAGANIGAYTVPAATRVGPTGRVVAVEAHPRTFGYLQRAVAMNRLDNVTPLNVALGDAPGEVVFAYVSANPGESHVAAGTDGGQKVAVVTLDAALAGLGIGPVAYLKIDVEGYEPMVLAGARATIAASPRIAVQTELVARHLQRYGGSIAAVAAFFGGLGLAAHVVGADGTATKLAAGTPLPGEVVWMRPA